MTDEEKDSFKVKLKDGTEMVVPRAPGSSDENWEQFKKTWKSEAPKLTQSQMEAAPENVGIPINDKGKKDYMVPEPSQKIGYTYYDENGELRRTETAGGAQAGEDISRRAKADRNFMVPAPERNDAGYADEDGNVRRVLGGKETAKAFSEISDREKSDREKRKDTVVFKTKSGGEITIPRGDMSDADWKVFQDRAAQEKKTASFNDQPSEIPETLRRFAGDLKPELEQAKAAFGPMGVLTGGPVMYAADKLQKGAAAVAPFVQDLGAAVRNNLSAAAPGVVSPAPKPAPVSPPGAPPTAPAGAPPAAAPQGQPQPSGMSAGMRVKGPVGAAPPPVDAQMQRMDDAVAMQRKAIENGAQLESEKLQKMAELEKERENLIIDQQTRMRRIDESVQTELSGVRKAYQGVMDELSKPEATVNPDRYWESHSKFAAAIGLALASRGKDGGAGLRQSIENGINRDIKAQQDAIEGRRDNLKTKGAMLDNLYGKLRQSGLDRFETEKAFAAITKEQLAARAQNIAMASGSELVKNNAAKTVGELLQSAEKDKMDLENHRQANALKRAQTAEAWASVGLKNAKAKAGGGASQELKGPQAEVFANGYTAINKVRGMLDRFKKVNSGVGESIVNKVTGNIPNTEASKFNNEAEAALGQIMPDLQATGVIQPGEVERLKALMPNAGDIQGKQKLETMLKDLENRMRIREQVFKQAGFQLGGMSQVGAPPPRPSSFQADEDE